VIELRTVKMPPTSRRSFVSWPTRWIRRPNDVRSLRAVEQKTADRGLLGIEPSGLDDFTPLYNKTPGVSTWIARAQDGRPSLHSYFWGFMPYWSKDPKKNARPVNARAQTAHEKSTFRRLIRERRCLIPVNCYYEWKEMPIGKRPYCVWMEDESPFFLGSMWDVWHAREPDALSRSPS
jgi:putative SOS response-associated peptidase YedK